jgi:hypothetical protein
MAVHLINYNYSKKKDTTEPIEKLKLKVHLFNGGYSGVKIHSLQGGDIKFESSDDGKVMNVKLFDVPLYTVVELIK